MYSFKIEKHLKKIFIMVNKEEDKKIKDNLKLLKKQEKEKLKEYNDILSCIKNIFKRKYTKSSKKTTKTTKTIKTTKIINNDNSEKKLLIEDFKYSINHLIDYVVEYCENKELYNYCEDDLERKKIRKNICLDITRYFLKKRLNEKKDEIKNEDIEIDHFNRSIIRRKLYLEISRYFQKKELNEIKKILIKLKIKIKN